MRTGDALTERIIGPAIDVHRRTGPGLLEPAYEQCLCLELAQACIPHQRQAPLTALYKSMRVEIAFRAVRLAADEVIVELKAVEHLSHVHEAPILAYPRMTGYRVSGCCWTSTCSG